MKLVGITLLVLTIMIPTTIYASDDDDEEDFNKFLKSKGIDHDDDYHWLSAEEQRQIEEEFRQEHGDDDFTEKQERYKEV